MHPHIPRPRRKATRTCTDTAGVVRTVHGELMWPFTARVNEKTAPIERVDWHGCTSQPTGYGLANLSSETCDLYLAALRRGRSRFCEIAQNELLSSGLHARRISTSRQCLTATSVFAVKRAACSRKGRQPVTPTDGAGAVPAGGGSSLPLSGGPGIDPAGITTGARGASLKRDAKVEVTPSHCIA